MNGQTHQKPVKTLKKSIVNLWKRLSGEDGLIHPVLSEQTASRPSTTIEDMLTIMVLMEGDVCIC
ncbi:hypothetical protein SynA1524_00596 [Synechococcus sp. A15-24]|nr:hypothetical protein SynA1524_00596 [Synechococcus sp. A15-24]